MSSEIATGCKTMKAVLNSMVHIPLSVFRSGELDQTIKTLTITPKDFGTFGPPPSPIESFSLADESIAVPIQWGLDFCRRRQIEVTSELIKGVEAVFTTRPNPHHPKAPKGQAEFFEAVISAMNQSCVTLACAPTGTGKTATGLNTICEYGRAGLIIVHSKEIARQWREQEIPKHLGIPASEVGVVEESTVRYKDCRIVVAVIHNIILKELPEDFYTHFGTIVWDEGHKLGAPAFNESTRYFAAHKKLVLTATPDRKDGCMRLITNYFGHVRAKSESTPLECHVRSIEYIHKRKYHHMMPRATLINCVTELEDRNRQLATLIFSLYKAGRNFIGLSDRIPQLQTILEMLYAMGVPERHLALYTRTYTDSNGKKCTTTAEELQEFREHARIFLATYPMAKEGLDIPRLDSGMCLSPTADGVQAIGRITRLYDNKPTPIWYVVRDTGIAPFVRSFASFMRSVKDLPHVRLV